MKFRIFVDRRGQMKMLIVCILIGVKSRAEENAVFAIKAKKNLKSVHHKQSLFDTVTKEML